MTNKYQNQHENTLTIYSMFFDHYKYRCDKKHKIAIFKEAKQNEINVRYII